MMFNKENRTKLLIAFVIAALFTLVVSAVIDLSNNPVVFYKLLLIKVFLIFLAICILILGRDAVFITFEKKIVCEKEQTEELYIIKNVGKDLAKALNRKDPLTEKEIQKIIEVLDKYQL